MKTLGASTMADRADRHGHVPPGGHVTVVLHGGLGNQLFQFFAACCEALSSGCSSIHCVTDYLARYAAARELEIGDLLARGCEVPCLQVSAGPLVRLRIPKLVWKLSGREVKLRLPPGHVLLDGYFQHASSLAYPAELAGRVLSRWRSALGVDTVAEPTHDGAIAHVRLGDFHASRDQALDHARQRIKALHSPCDIVSDQDELIQQALQELGDRAPPCRLRPTRDLTAMDMLEMFGSYRRIATNGSSLAFWSAVLYGRTFESVNPEHVRIWHQLAQ